MQHLPGLPHMRTGTVSQMCTQTHTCTHTHYDARIQGRGWGSGSFCMLFINAQLLQAWTSFSQGSYCTTQFIKNYCPCAHSLSKYKAEKSKRKNQVPSNVSTYSCVYAVYRICLESLHKGKVPFQTMNTAGCRRKFLNDPKLGLLLSVM